MGTTWMEKLPFDRPGRFFRGNIHAHSDASDGLLPLDEAISAYRMNNYDFLAITDHFLPQYDFPITDTRCYRTTDFTTLIGAELHAPSLENGEPWHILAVGLPLDFSPPGEADTGPTLAAKAFATGAFVGIAHPAWYGLSSNDIQSVEFAHAIEVFNQGCAADSDRGDSWHITDQVLARGRRLTTFGADDAHFRPSYQDTFGTWTMVKAEENDPDALLDSLKRGFYYTSQGPLIHNIALNGDHSELEIHCSPVNSIMLIGPKSRHLTKHGAAMTHLRFPLETFQGSYCRITIIDAAGRRAWSNPIWLD
jgi:hypothetical protein